MKTWKPSFDGYVMQYMVAGPCVKPYTSNICKNNQLELEATLRREIVADKPEQIKPDVRLGGKALNGSTWQIWAPFGNCYVDKSAFYSKLQKVSMEVSTALYVTEKTKVKARVWTYMAAAVYCNGKKVAETVSPVYKPMHGIDFEMELEKGKNTVYFICDNLGVRDTRNMLGLQLLDCTEYVTVCLPDEKYQDDVYEKTEFLAHMKLVKDKVVFEKEAPEATYIIWKNNSSDKHDENTKTDISGMREYESFPEKVTMVSVNVRGQGYELERHVELSMRKMAVYEKKHKNEAEDRQENIRKIAAVDNLDRGEFNFAVMNILARKSLGMEKQSDREQLFNDLRLMEERVDCADFLLSGFIRYLNNYEVDAELAGRIKEVFLDFRYWMSMKGSDAMCFWSENHSLMFYSAAMFAGQMYPEDYFTRAEMTGRKLHNFGKDRVLQWLEDVEKYGFEEFLSSVYMCVTFAALLNLVDYADAEISARASVITDTLLEKLAVHTFQGTVIAPMGRVYRGIIYPFCEGIQSLIHMIDPEAPEAIAEGWNSYLATSRYRFPENIIKRMREAVRMRYMTGNAGIVLVKTRDYCLTSVESPITANQRRWENVRYKKDVQVSSHDLNKSLNECFHGTSFFAPGVYGYQQHMWMAALSPEAVLFANHPGTSVEQSDMRPGYWDGNGVMPAVSQREELLGAIYEIPEMHPIHFIHLYCPVFRFDESVRKGKWMFLRKNHGYAGIWFSNEMVSYDDTLMGCEFRIYASSTACICLCGSQENDGTFEEFMIKAAALEPVYDTQKKTLTAGDYSLIWEGAEDRTQFVD